MKKIVMVLAALMLLLPVSGCNSEETRTVEWYLKPENKAAWEAKIAQCKDNPGELGNSPNCINARKAFDRQFLRGGERKPTVEPEFGFGKK